MAVTSTSSAYQAMIQQQLQQQKMQEQKRQQQQQQMQQRIAQQQKAQQEAAQRQAAQQQAAQQQAAAAAQPAQQAAQTTGYTPSAQVQAAQQKLQQFEASKPQGYQSKYGAQLEDILNQINNKKDFQYSFNGDALFKNYADLYSQNAKQASMNSIGQASALTGGYGNSWAQQAGQQAYDETMRGLYDIGLDLRDRAYQKYKDDVADLYDKYGTLSAAEEKDYGRYQDDVSAYERELQRLTDAYNTERNFEESQRQFNESLEWDKMSSQQKYAYETAISILANGGMPSDALLQAAGLSAEDAAKLMAQVEVAAAGGGGGGGGGGTRKTTTTTGNDLDPIVLAQMQKNAEARDKSALDAANAAAAAQTKQAQTRATQTAAAKAATYQDRAAKATANAAAAAQTKQAQERKAATAAAKTQQKKLDRVK